MKRRIISFILAMCLLVSMVPYMGVRASAVSNEYFDEFGITFEQLFSSYPKYLYSKAENDITLDLIEGYTSALKMHKGESKQVQKALDVLCNKGLIDFALEEALSLFES